MALSQELMSQFAKLVTKDKKTHAETTVYGTIVIDSNGNKYVKLDGSDQLTPLSDEERPAADSATADTNEGDRVSVLIKNHTATVTGNVSSPAARTGDVANLGTHVSEFDILIGHQITADDINVVQAHINEILAITGQFEELLAVNAEFESLKSEFGEFDKITADQITTLIAKIDDLKAETISTGILDADLLSAFSAEIEVLKTYTAEFTYISAVRADVNTLNTKKLDANWANIDYANIDKAILEEFYSTTGLIKDVTIGDATITGELVGVTIRGDLIKAHTLVADKLVIKGEDGLYYALNTAGRMSYPIKYVVVYDSTSRTYTPTTEITNVTEGTLVDGALTTDGKEVYVATVDGVDLYFYIEEGKLITDVKELELIQTDENSLDGRVIAAKSISASKIAVTDLVAFGATIGGFKLTDNSIHSLGKESVDSSIQGFYVDNDGQFAVGDGKQHIIYYKDTLYFSVAFDSDSEEYTDTLEAIDPVEGTAVEGTYTADGKQVYITTDGSYFCTSDIYKLTVAAESVTYTSNATLKDLSDRIDIGTYEDPETGDSTPSVELSDSNNGTIHKQILTGVKNVFTKDGVVCTKVDMDGVTGDDIVANREIRHNNIDRTGSYGWRFRANGNYGLSWKGVTS